jgi:hypothetical protein
VPLTILGSLNQAGSVSEGGGGWGGALEAPGAASRRRSWGMARVITAARSRMRKVTGVNDTYRGMDVKGERQWCLLR